jgi:hypothetical protein
LPPRVGRVEASARIRSGEAGVLGSVPNITKPALVLLPGRIDLHAAVIRKFIWVPNPVKHHAPDPMLRRFATGARPRLFSRCGVGWFEDPSQFRLNSSRFRAKDYRLAQLATGRPARRHCMAIDKVLIMNECMNVCPAMVRRCLPVFIFFAVAVTMVDAALNKSHADTWEGVCYCNIQRETLSCHVNVSIQGPSLGSELINFSALTIRS